MKMELGGLELERKEFIYLTTKVRWTHASHSGAGDSRSVQVTFIPIERKLTDWMKNVRH